MTTNTTNWIPPEPLVEELAAMSPEQVADAIDAIREAIRDQWHADRIDAYHDTETQRLLEGEA